MSFVAVSACLLIIFNILMWFIFFHRFNAFFSTEKIIEETRSAINEKIREANNAAERNMNLIDGKIQELNKVQAEADRRLAVLKRELDTQQRESEFRSAVASNVHVKTSKKAPAYTRKGKPVQAELAFTEKARSELGINENILPDGSVQNQNEHETKVAETYGNLQKIPVVNPVVYMADDFITPKKDFNQQVRDYHMAGIPAEEIARLTGRSAQEVRLVIQML